jgi:hypothetical protein
MLDQILVPGDLLAPTDPDPRTVWSALGTPMIDPEGSNDAARQMTMQGAAATGGGPSSNAPRRHRRRRRRVTTRLRA